MKHRLRTAIAAAVVAVTGAGAWAQFPPGGGASGSGTGATKKALPANGQPGATKKAHHTNGQTTAAQNSSTTTPTTDFAQKLSHIVSLAAFLVDEFGLAFETPQEKAKFVGQVARLYYTGQASNGGASNMTGTHQHTGQ